MEFIKTSSPHISGEASTSKIMTHVLVALLPALVMSGMIFGGRALMLVAFCVLTSMLWELISGLILKRGNTTADLSAAVSGMIFAMTLPPTVPFWMAGLGTFMTIVIFKQIFGGLGRNILNPALASRLVLRLVFSARMTLWAVPFTDSTDVTTGPTPIVTGAEGYYDIFMGSTMGCIGEVSKLALITGLVYLAAMRVTDLYASLSFVGTVCMLSYLIGENGLYQILIGGVMFAAVFCVSDYTTTPVTGLGKLIFGMGCGLITCVIRFFTPFTEGVTVAVLAMNLLTPLIDRLTERRNLG